MSSGVETVLFDLDDTLCEQRRSTEDVLAEAFDVVGVEPFFTAAEYDRVVDEIGGTDSDVRRRERCFERLARKNDRDATLGRRVAVAHEGLRDYTDVRFLPGAERTLERLAESYRLGLVTNGGPDTQSPKIDVLDLRDVFDTVVLAGYDAPAKPDPRPYERAMDDLNTAPDRTVYVGNSLATDVPGAQAAGIRAAWIPDGDPPADPGVEPEYVLESVRDLLDRPWDE